MSGGEESDGALSSDDGNEASFLSQSAARPKIKLKRGPAALDTGDAESQGEADVSEVPSSQPPDIDSATGVKRKRPIKQLRAKPLRVALTTLLTAFKK